MKNTTTNLSFDELEREMEVLDRESVKSILGGKFPPKDPPIDPDSVYTGSLGGGGGYVSDGKNSGFNSGYGLGGFTGAGNTPSMDNSSSSNPNGNNGPGPVPSIVFGPLTASSISQEMTLGFGFIDGVGAYLQENQGISIAAMTATGGIGVAKDISGNWIAAAGFNVKIPDGTNPEAHGTVNVYINGNYYNSFSLNDSKYSTNGMSFSDPNMIPTNGSIILPNSFDGSQTVKFEIRLGTTTRDAAGLLLTNTNQSGQATLNLHN
ncbi:hypothetical protein [Pedobacter sp. UYP1]|uniref:hypothetical protein n=1 Tax=Pedobacter sp. UYP1 TaxID=1756396 RepID=UPI0033994517